ncbi:odorant receptor 131-2-like [Phyllobates terribilis]|uniref:odorant receptor 131-2-like n=1 Tax=Phyllobates terribilis TaxID=111132 RepID=UPI003CCA83D7
MVNFTADGNKVISLERQIVRNTFLAILFLSFCVFIYFVTVILHAFFTSPHVRENARYVLFIHMLINDALMIFVLIFLFPMTIFLVYIPVPICYALVTFSASAFLVTPYNLAIMSLERYLAICYPLRHAQVCNVQRSLLAIGIMWIVSLAPQLLDFIAMCYSMPKGFFSASLVCVWPAFVMNDFQVKLRSFNEISGLSLVGFVIFYTYINVMVVARKIGSGKSSSFKADKTILLHALQLGLCMMSYTSSLTDTYLTKYFFFIPITNFFFFLCLPRFINPLIYGIRDEVFQKHMRKVNFFIS